jgi:hypothetical protein
MESFVLTESSRIFPFAFPSFGRVPSTLRYVDTKKASRDFNVEKWVSFVVSSILFFQSCSCPSTYRSPGIETQRLPE